MSGYQHQRCIFCGQRAMLDLYSIETNRVDIIKSTCHLLDNQERRFASRYPLLTSSAFDAGASEPDDIPYPLQYLHRTTNTAQASVWGDWILRYNVGALTLVVTVIRNRIDLPGLLDSAQLSVPQERRWGARRRGSLRQFRGRNLK